MTDITQEPDQPDQEEQEEEKREWYTLGQDVNVAGEDRQKGGRLQLTSEQYESMKSAGVRFEGEEPKKPEEIQEAHDEQVEAVRKRHEEARLERAEQFERDKAYQAGRDFDEEGFRSEYERRRKLTEGDEWQMPEKNEEAAEASQEMKDAERAARGLDTQTAESVEQTNPRPGSNPPASVGIAQGNIPKT